MNNLRALPVRAPAQPVDRALTEIDIAIALVLGGAARRIRICGLPAVEHAAATGLARAQAAGLAFELQRDPLAGGAASLVIGPAAGAGAVALGRPSAE